MNKTALRNFCIWSRRYLIEQISTRAEFLGIHKDGRIDPIQARSNESFMVNGVTFDFRPEARDTFEKMVKDDSIGWDNAIEEIAYTWFNRILAIRFMEVNGYLENGINGECIYVIGSTDSDRAEPDAVYSATQLKYVDKEIVYEFQDREDNAGLFRYILRKQCMELSNWMPDVFEKVSDYTELLMPETLLLKDGIIDKLTHDLDALDFDISAGAEGQVEIFGWMYQFYISEKKDEVKGSNKKVNKKNLPAATQLFTPDWIVRYMVQNTLGKIWITSQPLSNLKDSMKYYLEPEDGDDEVTKIHEEIKKEYKDKNIRDIKFIDPCCGSGHVLVYAFDLFYKMYLEEGYTPEMIPSIILENNLVGLDVDKRAIQLTSFALTMKARSYNKNLFHEDYVFPNVIDVKESNRIQDKDVDVIAKLTHLTSDEKGILEEVIFRYKDAEYFGTLINKFDYTTDEYKKLLKKLSVKENMIVPENVFEHQIINEWYDIICGLIKTAALMSDSYDCVVTNPPYQSPSACKDIMNNYAKMNYPFSKADMYAMFIERCNEYLNKSGLLGMITMHGWMFLISYDKLREKLMKETFVINMAHLGPRAFEDISGEVVQTTAFIMKKHRVQTAKGLYIKLTDFNSEKGKEKEFLNRKNWCYVCQEEFKKIVGAPFTAYSASDALLETFDKYENVGTIANPRVGMATASNDTFVRLWYEVEKNKIGFNCSSREDALESKKKWFPFAMGGELRKWYGNNDSIVNWEKDGAEIRNFKNEKTGKVRSHNYNLEFIFQSALTWTVIGTDRTSFRYCPKGFLYSNSGYGMFCDDENMKLYVLGLMNSKVAMLVLNILSPSMGFESGYIRKVPIIPNEIDTVVKIVKELIEDEKEDWDFSETSWDFLSYPVIRNSEEKEMEKLYNQFKDKQIARLARVKKNEEKLNEIFIKMYNLENEISSEMDNNDITIRELSQESWVKALISYAVGCIMGRYSLKQEGLIYAGGEWDFSRYAENFKPCEYGVMIITEEQYFEEDLCTRVIDFIEVVYGKDTLKENLNFIAQVLKPGAKESARKVIRNYLYDTKGFFDNHYQTYQHRPIYWMMSSGKNGGFRAIIYMHRYDQNTLSIVRTDLLHELRYKYEADQNLQHKKQVEATTTVDRNDAKKKISVLDKKIVEVNQYDDLLNHATGNITEFIFDLDDGVKTNYSKFLNIDGVKTQNLLVPIKL